MDTPPSRRTFLAALAALTGGAYLNPSLAAAEAPTASTSREDWDLAWLDGVAGTHKQVFDLGRTDLNEDPMRAVRNWLDAAKEVFGLEAPQVTTIVGITGSYPALATDATWAAYHLGEHWKIKDPSTGAWATRNVVAVGGTTGTNALMKRGTIFWQCNNALRAISREMATALGRPDADVYAELRAGLLPGVKLVPAHTLLLGLVQERGCSYQRL